MPSIGKERQYGQLLKTGQTTQYAGYEDDGYFEKGLSKLYTVLDAGQYAGTTSITLYNKTELISNNCVYDQRTKLMWARNPPSTLGTASTGKLPWTTDANGQGIFAYAAAANVAKLGGYSDWRVPNLIEFFSLVFIEATAGKADPTAFPLVLATDYFWTSTTRPDLTTAAIKFRFSFALNGQDPKTTAFWCMLVRGG